MTLRTGTRAFFLAGLLLLAAGAEARAADDAADDGRAYRGDIAEGVALLRLGDRNSLAEALPHFKQAQKRRPQAAEPLFWIALTLSDHRAYARAESWARDAVELSLGRSPEPLLLYGQLLLYQAVHFADAERSLRTARELFLERNRDENYILGSYLATFSLGRTLFHKDNATQRDFVEAYRYFDAIWSLLRGVIRPDGASLPELYPVVIQSLKYKGYCLDRLGNASEAVTVYQEALSRHPDDLDTRMRLAAAFRRLGAGGVANAEREFAEVLRRDPNQYEAELRLAHLLATRQPPDRPGAELRLRHFLELAPPDHPWYARARQYVDGGAEPAP